tara:strand:+ start:256 stop:627 length:372 start_codon:yes stop_codon:yes gene_type:complete
MSRRNSKRMSKKLRKNQRGGVGFSFDHGCKVGGLPARVATNDCPSVGPLDSCHIKALYGNSCSRQAGGARKSKRSNRKSNRGNRKSNRGNRKSNRVNRKLSRVNRKSNRVNRKSNRANRKSRK